MQRGKVLLVCLLALVAAIPLLDGFAQTPSEKPFPRARQPEFDERQIEGIFFKDVFSRLVGQRPEKSASGPATIVADRPGSGASASSPRSTRAWSQTVSAETLENEVKRLNQDVQSSITTLPLFTGSGHKAARRDFSMLAVLFGVIADYDGKIRWQADAPTARDLFARAAGNAKAGGNSQVYSEAKLRKQDLADLVRGNSLPSKGESSEADWGAVADRAPLMQMLDMHYARNLQTWTSSDVEFSQNLDGLGEQAELVALIADVLMTDGMDDADDDDYRTFAELMKQHALGVVAATREKNRDQARMAVGQMRKACDDCHDGFK